MILAYAIIFLAILAIITGRDLNAIGKIQYQGGWKMGAVLAGLFLLQALFVVYIPGQTLTQMSLLMASQLCLICFILLNRHLPGAKLFVLGVILNTIVMAANGGWMPITPDTYHFLNPDHVVELQDRAPGSKGIMLPYSDTRLWMLSDIIKVNLVWHRSAMSIGDLFLIIGIAYFLFQATPSEIEKASPRWSGP